MQRRTFVTLLAASPLAACVDPARQYWSLHGSTMGTRYSLKCSPPADGMSAARLRGEIDRLLLAVNRAMSTYDPDSELSRFNRFRGGDAFVVSEGLHRVVDTAAQVSELSRGSFDVTVGPLVDAWGFGPHTRESAPPPQALLDDTLSQVGYRRLQVLQTQALRKAHPELTVDLSGIAKGYGVDRVAALLESRGVSDYLLEIGGELRARGRNRDAGAWRIAIEEPLPGRRSVRRIVHFMPDAGAPQALATSGNYRNFFQHRGRRYSHLIDPQSGWPVAHRLASVTVIAPSTLLADAWSTALLVAGPERGAALAEREGLAALFISAGEQGFREHASRAFRPYLEAA